MQQFAARSLPIGRPRTTDGRINCRVYRSSNGIVEAGSAIEAMPDASRMLDAPGPPLQDRIGKRHPHQSAHGMLTSLRGMLGLGRRPAG